MKAGWTVKPLGDLIEKLETVDPRKMTDTEFEYVDVSSVSKETFSIKETTTLVGSNAPSRARRKIRENDVIFATIRPTLRRIAYVPSKLDQAICSTGYMVLRSKSDIVPKYLFYYLFSADYSDAMQSLEKGASYPAVTDGEVRQQPIPLPPLDEQKRIVAVLDAAFDGLTRARANVEANLQNARELFESYLVTVFSKEDEEWTESYLESLVDENCSLSYGIVQPGDDVVNGLPIVRPTDLKTNIIKLGGLKRINPSLADGYMRTKLLGSELLLCVRGSTGVVSVASEELAGGNVTRGIVPIRFEPTKVIQKFGYYQMVSKGVQDQIRAGTYGAALMQINIRDVRKINLKTPSLETQKKLLPNLEESFSKSKVLIQSYQSKLNDLDELRQSLLQKAFAGELT